MPAGVRFEIRAYPHNLHCLHNLDVLLLLLRYFDSFYLLEP